MSPFNPSDGLWQGDMSVGDPCIWCPSTGPFTVEHVVCAGLGGDDRAWLLEDCVCDACNGAFSKLETKLLKASGAALARLFLQPHTRNRKQAPTIQTKLSYHRADGTGLLLDHELKAGGTPYVLPQLLVLGAVEVAILAKDIAEGADFIAVLQASLKDEVRVIEKVRDGFEVRYRVTPLVWKDQAYVAQPSSDHQKSPGDGFWLEPLAWPVTAQAFDQLPPRIYRRSTGQLVCRMAEPGHVPIALTALRLNPDVLDPKRLHGATASASTGGSHLRILFDAEAYDRVLTKIGINLCAKLIGADFVRGLEFAPARDYARNGNGAQRCRPAPPEHGAVLGPALPRRHLLMLVPQNKVSGGVRLVFMSRLYGGPVQAAVLAEFAGPVPKIPEEIVVHVDYVLNKIDRMSLAEHAQKVVDAGGGS